MTGLVMPESSRWINIETDDGSMEGYLALPPAGSGPGIVLLQEIFGVNRHIRAIADQYASAGFVVLAPDIFWRSQRRLDLGYSAAELEEGLSFWRVADVDRAVRDVGASAKALRSRSETIGRVAAIGYCFGGRLAYLAAAKGHLDAAVAYYGGGIQNQLDVAAQIRVPILFHYADHDEQIPMASVDDVKKSFDGRDLAEFCIYPETHHGFNCWERETFQQKASALALGRTLVFLAAEA